MVHSKAATAARRGSGLALLALGMMSSTAMAQTSPALDRVSIWVGGYYTDNDTKIGAGVPNTQFKGKVNLENDLNFPEHKTVPRVRADILLGEHQGLSFDYYRVDRSHSRTYTQDVMFGGNDYTGSATAKGRLNFDFGSVAYRWWFGQGNDVFGLGLGGAYYKVKAGISGSLTVNGRTASSSIYQHDSEWAPLLQLGWRHAFNDQWRMYIDASGVKKNGGDLSGHIYNASLGLEWFPWRNFGLGAEYGYTHIKLNRNSDRYDADLDMKLNGPSLFARFRF